MIKFVYCNPHFKYMENAWITINQAYMHQGACINVKSHLNNTWKHETNAPIEDVYKLCAGVVAVK